MAPGKVRAAVGVEGGNETATAALALRVGVVPRTEVRGKFVPAKGLELGINVQALDRGRFSTMLMPTFLWYEYDTDAWFDEESIEDEVLAFGMPVIVGVSLDKEGQFQLFAGPDLRVGRHERERVTRAWSDLGLHLGLVLGGPRGYGALIPECSWMRTMAGRGEYGAGRFQPGANTYQCSLGVSFGARHAR